MLLAVRDDGWRVLEWVHCVRPPPALAGTVSPGEQPARAAPARQGNIGWMQETGRGWL